MMQISDVLSQRNITNTLFLYNPCCHKGRHQMHSNSLKNLIKYFIALSANYPRYKHQNILVRR